MRFVPLLALLGSGCFAPDASTPDAGSETDAGFTADAGPSVDPSCEGLVPGLPTTCDDRNGGCDARASCRVVSGGIECTCGAGFVGDGVECHPPGWSWVDAEPPKIEGAVYDKCLDRVLVRGADTGPVWSFDPRAPVGRQFRRLGLDPVEPLPLRDQRDPRGNDLALVGRALWAAGLPLGPDVNRARFAIRYDLAGGRRWERPELPELIQVCADGPGRLLGTGPGGVISIDDASLAWTDDTPDPSARSAFGCIAGGPGDRARLLGQRGSGLPFEIATRVAGAWRTESLPQLPPEWRNAFVKQAAMDTGGRLLADVIAYPEGGGSSLQGIWSIEPHSASPAWTRLNLNDEPRNYLHWLVFDARQGEWLLGITHFGSAPVSRPMNDVRPIRRISTLRQGENAAEPLGEPRPQPREKTSSEAAAMLGGRGTQVVEWGGTESLNVRLRTDRVRTFDLASRRWRPLEESGDAPFPRVAASIAAFTGEDRFLVFGGHTPGDPNRSNDVYELTVGTDAAWRKLSTTGDAPPPLSGSIVTIHDGFLWVIGGQQLHPTEGEGELTPESRAWRLALASSPAEWQRVDDGTLPHVRSWSGAWTHRAPTSGLTIPGLGFVAAGPTRAGNSVDQHYVFGLTVPVTARLLEFPEGLPPIGIAEASASLFHDKRRARLIVAGSAGTWAIALAVDGSLGPPLKLCTPSRGTAGWGFSVAEGLLTAPDPREGYVRLLDAATPACVE